MTAMLAGELGYIDTPLQKNATHAATIHAAGAPWCADNGAFSNKFDETKWWKFLVDNAPYADTCLFAVAPDVVGDAEATLARSSEWLPRIRALGYPAAYVAQNRLERSSIPWDQIDVLFVGGSLECLPCDYIYDLPRKPKRNEPCPLCFAPLTEWKLGEVARNIIYEAKARGLWVHMGRVNSLKRYRYAQSLGVDSADGTYLTFGADKNLPKLLSWVREPKPRVSIVDDYLDLS